MIAIDKGADVIQQRRVFGSDFVIIKDRDRFNKVITTSFQQLISYSY